MLISLSLLSTNINFFGMIDILENPYNRLHGDLYSSCTLPFETMIITIM